MNLVKRIAAQAGVGLDGVKLRIHKSAPRQGMFGQITPDGVLRLYPNAFRSEEELVKTLGHERTFGVSDDVVRTRIPSFRESPHRLDDDVIEEFEGGPDEERAER